MYAFHFTNEDGTTEYLKSPEEVGKTYSIAGPIRCCENGFHGSVDPLDACYYANDDTYIGIRELTGDIHEEEDKVAARHSTLICERKDAAKVLRIFSCDCAERVLPIYEAAFPDDKRPRHAIDVARRFAVGDATSKELQEAEAAVWEVDTGAWDRSSLAAMRSMRAAYYAAAKAATFAAASAAANAARRAACCTSEGEWQRRELTLRLCDLLGVDPTLFEENNID